jgi:phage I-like protein
MALSVHLPRLHRRGLEPTGDVARIRRNLGLAAFTQTGTQTALAVCFSELAAVDVTGAPPDWVQVIPGGQLDGRDGRGPFRMIDPQKVIDETRKLNMEVGLPLDFNHATDIASEKGGEAPAAGWMKDFKIGPNNSLMAHVEWTHRGKAALSRGPNGEPPEVRYLSPVFQFNPKTGDILSLLRAGLTNNPNLCDTAIHARKPHSAEEDPEQAKYEEYHRSPGVQNDDMQMQRRVILPGHSGVAVSHFPKR